MKTGKIISILLLIIWGIFCLMGILGNADHYRTVDWIVVILIALLPYAIFFIVKLNSKKRNMKSNSSHEAPLKSVTPAPNYQYIPQNQSFANIQTQNNLRILQETCNIMETTNNLETFFSRFEVGKKIVSDLNNRNYLSDFYKKANLLKFEVLQKSFQNEEKNISNLKTAKAQQKHWESYLALLKKYEEYYTTDYHTEYENVVKAVQGKITLAINGNDISKVLKEALTSGIKITSSIDNSDLEKYSREASERGYAAHVNSYRNLDFKNISLKNGKPLPLDETEKKFLKALSNQQVDKLSFPVYWTYEYHVNYKEWITKLIENGYVKITPATEDFSFLTVEQLKSVLRLLHLPISGKKQELIARISNQAGTENALKELGLYVERFVLTDIGREAVESIPPQEPYPKKDRLTLIMEMKEGLEKIGTKWYKIYVTIDSKTCPICREMNGKKFRMSDFQVGVTAPPFHDDCNCSIGPTTPDNEEDEDELDRIRREVREEIKKTNTLSEKERFEKWKEKFVYGDKSSIGPTTPDNEEDEDELDRIWREIEEEETGKEPWNDKEAFEKWKEKFVYGDKSEAYEDLLLEAEKQRKQLEDLNVKKYEILAAMDNQTCSKCKKMNGKVFDIKDYKPEVTAPPFCKKCRCTVIPHLDEELWK